MEGNPTAMLVVALLQHGAQLRVATSVLKGFSFRRTVMGTEQVIKTMSFYHGGRPFLRTLCIWGVLACCSSLVQ